MEDDVYRVKDEATHSRRLSLRAPRMARRNRIATFGLTAVALLIGIAAAFVWLERGGLGLDDFPADSELAANEPSPGATPGIEAGQVAPDAHVDGEEALIGAQDIADQAADQEVAQESSIPADAVIAGAFQTAGSATSVARLQSVLAAREPTPTATPLPFVDQVEAVVALGGAALYAQDTGVLAAQLPQGTLLAVVARSDDGAWLLGRTEPEDATGGDTAGAGIGWIAAEQLIVFDTRRLHSRAFNIVPATPTPFVAQILIPTATPAVNAPNSAAQAEAPVGSAAEQFALPEDFDGPVARINLTDARLNVRSGPDASYPIVTKAHPGEVFGVLGRSAASDWVQLAVPDVVDGFGWVVADYVDVSGALADVPLSTQVGTAPPYVEGAEAARVRQQRQSAVLAPTAGVSVATQHPVLAPAVRPQVVRPEVVRPQAGLQPSITGLQGKLVLQASWGGEIYLYELTTGELRLLTGGFDPAISPDGTQVAFTRAGGEHGLYLINTDGTNERMIFNGRELLRAPKWSPDGRWIVFERSDEYTDCRAVGRRCPSEQQPRPGYPAGIMRQPMLARVDWNGENYQDLAVLQSVSSPDWSDAGIVYASAAGIQLTQDEPGATTQEVYFQIQKQYELDPDLQPGGDKVVFQRKEASHWEIYQVNLDGSGLRALTRPEFTLVPQIPANVAPAWSPDGRSIVFLSNRQPDHAAGDWAVWVMDADGSNQRKLPIDLEFTYTYVGEQMVDWGR